MNILITGATGFIGSHLTKELYGQGYDCRCLVRNINKARRIFKDYEDIEFVVGDVTKPETLKKITDNIEIIFHLAALRGHDLPSKTGFIKFRKTNVEGVKNILKECKKAVKLKKIILLSSTATYGIYKGRNRIDEKTECNPYTPYQVSKYEGELLALKFYKSFNLPIVILKSSMVYGPGFKGDFLKMAKIAKKGLYPKLGTKKNNAPALYISDLISATILSMKKGKIGNIYLIASDKSYSQDEICDIFESFFKKHILRVYLPVFIAKIIIYAQEKLLNIFRVKPIVTTRNISSITHDRILNISKAKNELGFYPKVQLEKGLMTTLKWFKKEKVL